MSEHIFLMAQGQGSRWHGKDMPADIKQFIKIGREPILLRTLRLLDKQPVTVVTWKAYQDRIPIWIPKVELEDTGSIIHGIWQVVEKFKQISRFIFMLGDVVYSKSAIEKIVWESDPFSFYGRSGPNKVTGKAAPEIFALSFSRSHWNDGLRDDMQRLWLSDGKYGSAKLWTLMRWRGMSDSFVNIDDYTDDVDSPQEYDQFFEKLSQAVLEDK